MRETAQVCIFTTKPRLVPRLDGIAGFKEHTSNGFLFPLAGSALPHAVTSISAGNINTTFTYDPNGNQTSGLGRSISYTSYNKPSSITQGTGTLFFSDDVDHQRFKQVAPEGTTLYFNAFGVRHLAVVRLRGGGRQYSDNGSSEPDPGRRAHQRKAAALQRPDPFGAGRNLRLWTRSESAPKASQGPQAPHENLWKVWTTQTKSVQGAEHLSERRSVYRLWPNFGLLLLALCYNMSADH
jgi:hypothetical protein